MRPLTASPARTALPAAHFDRNERYAYLGERTLMQNLPSKPPQIKRLRIGLNVAAQIAIVAGIVFMINYIGFNRYARWDISRYNKYALSGLTKRFLKSLKKEVKIYVFFSPSSHTAGAELYGDVQNLLKEYAAA